MRTVLAMALPAIASAQRLAFESYSTVNGLGHNWINRIVPDSRGFVWFCTREGLSRYDGYGFITYGVDDGLPGAMVNNLLETPDGTYWVATSRGLSRFNPLGANGQKFTTVMLAADRAAPDVRALFQDRQGQVWVGVLGGLFSVSPDGRAIVAHPVPEPAEVLDLAEDPTGSIWAATSGGLYRIAKERRDFLTTKDGLPHDFVQSVIVDPRGRIWIATSGGIAILEVEGKGGRVQVVDRYGLVDGLPASGASQMIVRADGSIWAATYGGVATFEVAGRGYRIRTIFTGRGIGSVTRAIAEDRHQSLWVGGEVGATNLARQEVAFFGAAEGLGAGSTMVETAAGDLLVQDSTVLGTRIARLDGTRFISAEIPATRAPATWGWNQTFLIDREGDWWIGARTGVLRYRGVRAIGDLAHATPMAIYNRTTGLAADVVLRLFEDSRGDVWVSTVGESRANGLSRWRRSTGTWEHWSETAGLSLTKFLITSFAEDRQGDIWIGFSDLGGLARFRNNRWTRFDSSAGVPGGSIRNLLVDSRGRLWVPTASGGLAVTSTPANDSPRFEVYTTARGLSSNYVTAVVQGDNGEILAGTGRGLDRVDPVTGQVTPLASGRGWPPEMMQAAHRSRSGAFWFSFNSGLVRYTPGASRPRAAHTMLITDVEVSGERRQVSALGQADLPPFDLAAGLTMRVEFVVPGAAPAQQLRYQVKLEGGDNKWSPLSDQRDVTFANISPGSYRLAVRAMDVDGVFSPEAGFRFTVLAPIWRRWWFLSLAVVALAAVAHALYRRRVARLLEIAGMRARIATDLHDDIGANLTRIAVLSEVARQQPDAAVNGRKLDNQLASIADVARESMTAMSDIVWAISPERDSSDELVRKMREYAGEVCPDIALTFTGPDGARASRLGPDGRREVYLIFKEAMNNIARHADATAVDVRLVIEARGLVLEVRDNGTGFEPGAPNDGNGLVSIRRRADRLGAQLTITSAPGSGTTVHLDVPAGHLRQGRPRRP